MQRLLLNSQLVPLMLARVRAAGRPVAPLVARFGLPEDAEKRPELALPLHRFHEFSDAVAETVGDPLLGAHLGASSPKGHYGLVEFIARTSQTVREAVQALVRYSALLNGIVRFSLEEKGREAIFLHRIPGEPLCTGRHANEFMLVFAVQTMSALGGEPVLPQRAWFAHPRDALPEELAQLVGTARIEFGRGENGLRFDARVLDRKVLGAEPALHAFLQQQAQQVLASKPPERTLLDQVRAQIEPLLSRGGANAVAVAQALHMSPRTLQRRLAEEDVTFQGLVEEVRQSRARLYLDDPKIGLSEISFRLGYSDLRAFARAFRRWTGMSPGKYRSP